MTKEKFPSWAPHKVILEWEEKIKEVDYWLGKFPNVDPDTEEADLLFRLLTYNDMKRVWEKLPKYEIEADQFSGMVQLSALYLEAKPNNLTPKEHEEWLQDVKLTAMKLKELIQFSDYDSLLQENYYTKRNKHVLSNIMQHALQSIKPDYYKEDYVKTEPEYKNWPDFNPGKLSKNLHELANLSSDNEVGLLGIKSAPVLLDKPNHPNAKRSYFIKKLTQMLRESTGTPLREVVTITTGIVFDDPSITERQIIRTAP